MSLGTPMIALFLGILLVFGFAPGFREREFKGRSWMLLRALFPSWRFFDRLGEVPRLWFRFVPGKEGAATGEWKECLAPEARGSGTLFLNGRGNLRLAANSLLEQLLVDAADLPAGKDAAILDSVSYELTRRLVAYRIRSQCAMGDRFQFKITVAEPGRDESRGEDVLLSIVHEV